MGGACIGLGISRIGVYGLRVCSFGRCSPILIFHSARQGCRGAKGNGDISELGGGLFICRAARALIKFTADRQFPMLELRRFRLTQGYRDRLEDPSHPVHIEH